jgi:hypothetical protein
MTIKLSALFISATSTLIPLSAFAQMDFLDGVSLPNSGGEILSYYAPTNTIASTYSSSSTGQHGVRFTSLSNTGTLSTPTVSTVDLSTTFSASSLSVYSVSSVQVDNQGRDFGVATLIAGNDTNLARVNTLGKVVFFELSTGNVLGSVDVGYHPDSVSITADGSKLLIANEAEYVSSTATQRAGSVSVISLSGITSASQLATSLDNSSLSVTNVGFTGLDLSGIRINATNPGSVLATDRHLYVEPEYITSNNTSTKAYVSLQENNAIATINLATNTVESVRSLGTLTQTIDSSDRDGTAGIPGGTSNPRPRIDVNDTATGLLMPDTIVQFQKGGQTYIITANEGDARQDIIQSANDETRVGGSGPTSRLTVVAAGFDGAGNMFGTRSVSIVNATTGVIVWDSSDGQGTSAAFKSFEDYIAANDSETFGMDQNANAGFAFRTVGQGQVGNFAEGIYTNGVSGSGAEANSDTRSDNKGPEPEAVAYGSSNGRDFLFASMERQGGIFQFDITDLDNIFLVDYINLLVQGSSLTQNLLSPESLQFIAAVDSPTGSDVLLVGFENPSTAGSGSGGLAVINVSAIPEPSSYAAIAGGLFLGFAALRRRRSAR